MNRLLLTTLLFLQTISLQAMDGKALHEIEKLNALVYRGIPAEQPQFEPGISNDDILRILAGDTDPNQPRIITSLGGEYRLSNGSPSTTDCDSMPKSVGSVEKTHQENFWGHAKRNRNMLEFEQIFVGNISIPSAPLEPCRLIPFKDRIQDPTDHYLQYPPDPTDQYLQYFQDPTDQYLQYFQDPTE